MTRSLKLSVAVTVALFAFMPAVQAEPEPKRKEHSTELFELLDFQTVSSLKPVDSGNSHLKNVHDSYCRLETAAAREELLKHFRTRPAVVVPGVDLENITITDDERRWADEAFEHRFFVHTGYQPSFCYGEDIDWQYWPVKDNELRWQLHRMKWWVPMGKQYRLTGDERYAREWCAEYLDWIEKNPLENYEKNPDQDMLDADNVYFAWRPLEVSDRLQYQISQFLYFLSADAFTPDFLESFLINYHRHATHLTKNLSESGNHLLFQAQRLLYAGVFFPEFSDAAAWRKLGVEILNREIARQVYDDGMQYELDPHYHHEAVDIFFNALQIMELNGYGNEFPKEYAATIHSMIRAFYSISFPDYTSPLFSDNRARGREEMLPGYKAWSALFPEDRYLRYLATEGREGGFPDHNSTALRTSGFYTLRNGWDADATVAVFKAGPPAFWHNQPDNGTFELWRRGRNFFPDSGCYVYGGDAEILRWREWFRQTSVHNTLTLDGRTIERTDSKCLVWSDTAKATRLTVENPSYDNLTHRRTVWMLDGGTYVIIDRAAGGAEGDVSIHYNLIEGDHATDMARCSVATQFDDGNNISIRVFGRDAVAMSEREGRISRTYRHMNPRPAYAFTTHKRAGEDVLFATVISPDNPDSRVEWLRDGVVRVKIDRKQYKLKY